MKTLPPVSAPASRVSLESLIDQAIMTSDAIGETIVGCYLQMARDKLEPECQRDDIFCKSDNSPLIQ
jgi:hypothetical protein